SLYPSIAAGDHFAYDWTVTVDFVKDTHEVYEKIILRASPVSGKYYVSEADGFGSKQQLSFSDDGTGQYYVGMLSSYIAFGEWTADGDVVTLTVSTTEWDGEDAKGFSLNFRLNDDGSLTYLSNGAEAGRFEKYLHDGDRFVEGNRMEFYPNDDKTDNTTSSAKKIKPGDEISELKDNNQINLTFLLQLGFGEKVFTAKYDGYYTVALTDFKGTVENVITFDKDRTIIENTGAELFSPELPNWIKEGDTVESVNEKYGLPSVDFGSGRHIPGFITADGYLYNLEYESRSSGEMQIHSIIKYDLLSDVLATNSEFIYSGDGAGGFFHITLWKNGRFQYYEGVLSSYIGMGSWTLEDDILTLRDDEGLGKVITNENDATSFEETDGFCNRFRMEDGKLTFISEGSDNFLYVTLEDGAVFNWYNPSPIYDFDWSGSSSDND
ncbi:MAG: hypothetical protein IJR90_06635, partial [Clostridia bacterium]|nr:hypothetical protein [Clostridia bacterium]